MTNRENYQKRLGTPEGALALIRSGDTIAASLYGNEPKVFLMNLHRICHRVENVHLSDYLMQLSYSIAQKNAVF